MSSPLRADALSPVHLRPNTVLGSYPQDQSPLPGKLEQWLLDTLRSLPLRGQFRKHKARRFVGLVTAAGRAMEVHDRNSLRFRALNIRTRMLRDGLTESVIADSFALIRGAAEHTLGARHYDVQVMGGWAMMHGMLAEMATGEGKTLTATLPAATAALAGIPVHVITVNDYLAARDARSMTPIYESLGLTVGIVTADLDAGMRRAAYACDVTYCTAKQLAFDYLRDRMTVRGENDSLRLKLEKLHAQCPRSQRLLLRGLCFAIVDEADSVLVDEARTPLLIAGGGSGGGFADINLKALELVGELERGRHFLIDPSDGVVRLTGRGKARLGQLCQSLGEPWCRTRQREEILGQAIAAMHVFRRDTHYLVRDNKIVIIDPHTGRTMADRTWQRGLHQMIETKEKCELTTPPETLARISFQRFFRRYLRLAGMTGTAREVSRELGSVYGLDVFSVPANSPVRRCNLGTTTYLTAGQKWRAVADSVRIHSALGRPVLVGTTSVADSETLSAELSEQGISHQVLNARYDGAEAEIVARAGRRSCVTVATNMAGRGTDIPLGPGVAEIGGLHVIATERNEAGRIDRQLYGRCARQGDPGSHESFLSLEDSLIRRFGGTALTRLSYFVLARVAPVRGARNGFVHRIVQRVAEHRHRGMRRQLLHLDERLQNTLAFSGPPE